MADAEKKDFVLRADGTAGLAGEILCPSTIKGCGTLAATTVAAALSTTVSCSMVKLQSDPANTTNVLYGSATAQAMVLQPGQSSDWLPISNVMTIYAKMASSTGNVNWIAL